MKLFELFATLRLDSSEFDTGIEEAARQGRSLGDELEGQSQRAGSSWKEVFKGITASDMVKQAIEAAKQFAEESISLPPTLRKFRT